jgi:hypothetical protein
MNHVHKYKLIRLGANKHRAYRCIIDAWAHFVELALG